MLQLVIRTPEKLIFDGKVTKLSLQAADGKIGILFNHAPLATIVAPGQIKYALETGEEVAIDNGQGFLFVKDNVASVLLS